MGEKNDDDIPVVEEKSDNDKLGEYMGQCKWFNDRLGYGFLVVSTEGEKKATDVFVHHIGIKTKNSHYKTLRKGEYVQFDIGQSTIKGPHKTQAVNITGILGGPLMCDCNTTNGPPRPQMGPPMGPPNGYQRGPYNGYSNGPPPPPPRFNSRTNQSKTNVPNPKYNKKSEWQVVNKTHHKSNPASVTQTTYSVNIPAKDTIDSLQKATDKIIGEEIVEALIN